MLYIHIPFCDSKCGYCAFNSFANLNYLKKSYERAILIDLASTLEHKSGTFSSIYFGGGTPNTMDIDFYKSIFKHLSFFIDKNTEISMELNPLGLNFVEDILNLGVTRLSIGIQSFRDEKLRLLERDHTSDYGRSFIRSSYELGARNINIDLITNTPLDSPVSMNDELSEALDLPITHISCYGLDLEENSRLFGVKGALELNSDELFFSIRNFLSNAAFIHYEVSNYARDEANYCRHNLGYWSCANYQAIGAGAIAKLNNQRIKKHASLSRYIASPLGFEVERLDDEALNFEALFLGLRSLSGAPISSVNNADALNHAINERLISVKGGRIYANDLFLADELALRLS